MATLESAIEIAVAAHRGQRDKAGSPYILHPLRVMLALHSEEERIVGVLHDVVEDCPDWSLERLQREGFSGSVIDALRAVTKQPHEHGEARYMDFIDRSGQHPVGRAVKIADLADNMDMSRIENPTEADRQRGQRYRAARDRLLQVVHPTSTP